MFNQINSPKIYVLKLFLARLRLQESISEVAKESETSSKSKVDKVTADADHKAESTVRVAPMIKAGSDVPVTPPPPPPPSFLTPIKKKFQSKSKLPSLNWLPLRPNQIRGTIFNGLDDGRLRKIINFTHFEDKFRIIDKSQSPSNSTPTSRIRKPSFVTLLEPTRLRNVSIVLRKLNFDADVVIGAINDYNFNQLNLDSIDLLTNLAPKDSETEAYRNYKTQKKDIVVLSDEDKFLMKLSQVERLTKKLAVLDFIANFEDRAGSLKIQLCAVTSASLSLKSSKKFKGVLEIILALGNYCNSSKSSSAAYGFRLKGTFDRLSDVRSNDKKFSLLDYMVTKIIADCFPQLLTLDTELLCIHDAARISLKNVANEIASIKCGWIDMTVEEKLSNCSTLTAFKATSADEFNKLINELETTQNNYDECARFFGEEKQSTMDSDEFFSIVDKFLTQFRALSGKVKPTRQE